MALRPRLAASLPLSWEPQEGGLNTDQRSFEKMVEKEKLVLHLNKYVSFMSGANHFG